MRTLTSNEIKEVTGGIGSIHVTEPFEQIGESDETFIVTVETLNAKRPVPLVKR